MGSFPSVSNRLCMSRCETELSWRFLSAVGLPSRDFSHSAFLFHKEKLCRQTICFRCHLRFPWRSNATEDEAHGSKKPHQVLHWNPKWPLCPLCIATKNPNRMTHFIIGLHKNTPVLQYVTVICASGRRDKECPKTPCQKTPRMSAQCRKGEFTQSVVVRRKL